MAIKSRRSNGAIEVRELTGREVAAINANRTAKRQRKNARDALLSDVPDNLPQVTTLAAIRDKINLLLDLHRKGFL